MPAKNGPKRPKYSAYVISRTSKTQERLESGIKSQRPHLEAIGLVTVSFALLENELKAGIKSRLQILDREDELGEALTADLAFQSLLAVFSSVFRTKLEDPSQIAALELMTARLGEVAARRNQVVHSAWATADAPDRITRRKASVRGGKGVRVQTEELTVEELHDIAAQIERAARDVQLFWMQFDPFFQGKGEVAEVIPGDQIADDEDGA